jgi:release factor glutamine methyltransferase
MNISEVIKLASQRLQASSDSPQLDAELLLGIVLHKSRAQLYTHANNQINSEDLGIFEGLLEKRLKHVPIAYITGIREFWSLRLKVSPNTLVPRPETEILVEQSIARIPKDTDSRVLDLGTGTGAIILAIGNERPNAQLHATEISTDALDVAKDNGNRCKQIVRWYKGDWFSALNGNDIRILNNIETPELFDIIVSNPPYISLKEIHLTSPELNFEPDIALYSGPDGLDAIRIIIGSAKKYLLKGGWLILEHGLAQGEAVRQLFAKHGFAEISTASDLSGIPRVTAGRSPETIHEGVT